MASPALRGVSPSIRSRASADDPRVPACRRPPTPPPGTRVPPLMLLALGARRLEQLEGTALTAFGGSPRGDDLGPRWIARRLGEHPEDSVRDLARDLTELLVRRAQRVALSKMEPRGDRFWLPSRVREREGL